MRWRENERRSEESLAFRRVQGKFSPHLLQSRERKRERAEEKEEVRGGTGRAGAGSGLPGLGRMQSGTLQVFSLLRPSYIFT